MTPTYLTRALESIKNQTHKDYKVYLVGDRYDNHSEFVKLAESILPKNNIYYTNLDRAKERDLYPLGSLELWCSGGVNARNRAIDIALADGVHYICPLDHDDYWSSNHLKAINNVLESKEADFVYTCSTYLDSILPIQQLTSEIVPSIPQPGKLIHSSVCINYDKIPLKYRDVYSEIGIVEAADYDLWKRVSKYIPEHTLKSYLVAELTCYHPNERC